MTKNDITALMLGTLNFGEFAAIAAKQTSQMNSALDSMLSNAALKNIERKQKELHQMMSRVTDVLPRLLPQLDQVMRVADLAMPKLLSIQEAMRFAAQKSLLPDVSVLAGLNSMVRVLEFARNPVVIDQLRGAIESSVAVAREVTRLTEIDTSLTRERIPILGEELAKVQATITSAIEVAHNNHRVASEHLLREELAGVTAAAIEIAKHIDHVDSQGGDAKIDASVEESGDASAATIWNFYQKLKTLFENPARWKNPIAFLQMALVIAQLLDLILSLVGALNDDAVERGELQSELRNSERRLSVKTERHNQNSVVSIREIFRHELRVFQTDTLVELQRRLGTLSYYRVERAVTRHHNPGVRSNVVDTLEPKEVVILLEQCGVWIRVRLESSDGSKSDGWVLKKYLRNIERDRSPSRRSKSSRPG